MRWGKTSSMTSLTTRWGKCKKQISAYSLGMCWHGMRFLVEQAFNACRSLWRPKEVEHTRRNATSRSDIITCGCCFRSAFFCLSISALFSHKLKIRLEVVREEVLASLEVLDVFSDDRRLRGCGKCAVCVFKFDQCLISKTYYTNTLSHAFIIQPFLSFCELFQLYEDTNLKVT